LRHSPKSERAAPVSDALVFPHALLYA